MYGSVKLEDERTKLIPSSVPQRQGSYSKINGTENEFSEMGESEHPSVQGSLLAKCPGIKLVTSDDSEHRKILEMRKGVNVTTGSKRAPLEMPSYEDDLPELNQTSPHGYC